MIQKCKYGVVKKYKFENMNRAVCEGCIENQYPKSSDILKRCDETTKPSGCIANCEYCRYLMTKIGTMHYQCQKCKTGYVLTNDSAMCMQETA